MAIKQGWIGRLLKIEPGISLGQWSYDRISGNWPLILSIFSWGGIGTVLVALTEPLKQYAPASWGVAFGLFALVGTIVLLLGSWVRDVILRSRIYSAASEQPRGINPLDAEFTRQTISLNDLIHPIGVPLKDKVFLACDFHGPGIIILSGCNLLGQSTYGNVEFLEVFAGGQILPNKAVLERCTLSNCRFYNVVVGMNFGSAADIDKIAPDAKWLARLSKQPNHVEPR